LLTALVLSACGGADATATPTRPAPTNTPTPTVGAGTPTPTPVRATATPTATPEPSFDAAEYFGGRTVKMITGTSPGGGYDTMLRIFGKVAPKHFPPNTKFVVQNIPGAAQLRGLQETLKADPDGFTVGATHQRWFIQQAIYGDVEGLDFENLTVIGSPTYGVNPQMFCAEKSVATSWQDVIDKGLTLKTGQTGPGNSPGPEFIDLIGGPIENVYGYGGSAEVMAAFDRGEINSVWGCGPGLSDRLFPEWATSGRLAPLFWWEDQFDDEWYAKLGVTKADVPHIFDLAGVNWTDLNKSAFTNWVKIAGISRTFLAPAGVDPAVLEYWRGAFQAVVEDPEFVQLVEAAGYIDEYGFAGGDEIKQALLEMDGLPADVKEILKGIAPQG
jgi:tripartite-type tricarboxylate transporter receptor subunit TctC